MIVIICVKYKNNPYRTVDATERTRFSKSRSNDLEDIGQGQRSSHATHLLMLVIICTKYGKNLSWTVDATGRTRKVNRQTDAQTDRQGESNIPPPNFVARGIMMTDFSLHISATLHLTIFGIWSNNIQSVQYVICVMIVRGLWLVGNWWYDTQYELLRIYVHHGAPFCVLTVKRHCLPLTRLPRVAGGAPAVNHKATAIWLALRILAGKEYCNVCDGNMGSEYIFIFLWPLMNECIQNMFVAFATICSVSMPNFTSICTSWHFI